MQPDNVELYLPSVLGYEKIARRAAETLAEQMDFNEDRIEDLKTAVAEACMNAIEHGNNLERSVSVAIQMMVSPDKLEVRVADVGHQTVPDKLPMPGSGDMRGWGMFFIKNLVDEMTITKLPDGGNEVRMTLYLKQAMASSDDDPDSPVDDALSGETPANDTPTGDVPGDDDTSKGGESGPPADSAGPAIIVRPPAAIQTVESKLGAIQPAEPKPSAIQPAVSKPGAIQPAEPKPSAIQPAEPKPSAIQPAESKPGAIQLAEQKPGAIQPAESAAGEVTSGEPAAAAEIPPGHSTPDDTASSPGGPTPPSES